ncbi:MAG: hydrogenase formation protein HypD [PVC group bacterium]
MKLLDSFYDPVLARKLAGDIGRIAGDRRFNLMEVCGTHTVSIFRSGLRSLLPPSLRLLSGPGCPVCVTPREIIDEIIIRSRQPGTVIATFGDMLNVPGAESTLRKEKSRGADVRMIYSPLEGLRLARENPGKKVIFLAIGFETTIPSAAAAVLEAEKSGIGNFFVLPAGRLIPPAMEFLLSGDDVKIDGFLCPGHVSVIIGTKPYRKIAERFHTPCVIAGFEPLDILAAIRELLVMITGGAGGVRNLYPRAVREEGNPRARKVMETVFQVTDAQWRGLGIIPASGISLRPAFGKHDAGWLEPVELPAAPPDSRCICGRILRGAAVPVDCPVFGTGCIPSSPLGPCMVSSEGTCAAWFRYGNY